MTELMSARNPKVELVRLLARDRRERESSGLALLEGVRLAEEAIRAALPVEYALYTAELAQRERGADLLQALRRAGTPLHEVSAQTLERAGDTRSPQGIVALFRPRQYRLEQLGPGMLILTDELQDPGNLGAIIRSLEAFGGAGVVVCGGVDPFSPKVVRGAMGSLFRVPVVKVSLAEALAELKAQGRPIYLAEAGATLLPWSVDLTRDLVLVVGNEGAGPSEAARHAASGMICIPMAGATESLNASVAASLLLYEALRQRSHR